MWYFNFVRHFVRHFEFCAPCAPFWRTFSYTYTLPTEKFLKIWFQSVDGPIWPSVAFQLLRHRFLNFPLKISLECIFSTFSDHFEFLLIQQFWRYYDVIDWEQKKFESIMMSPRNTSSTLTRIWRHRMRHRIQLSWDAFSGAISPYFLYLWFSAKWSHY